MSSLGASAPIVADATLILVRERTTPRKPGRSVLAGGVAPAPQAEAGLPAASAPDSRSRYNT